jgi:hypothetical protein
VPSHSPSVSPQRQRCLPNTQRRPPHGSGALARGSDAPRTRRDPVRAAWAPLSVGSNVSPLLTGALLLPRARRTRGRALGRGRARGTRGVEVVLGVSRSCSGSTSRSRVVLDVGVGHPRATRGSDRPNHPRSFQRGERRHRVHFLSSEVRVWRASGSQLVERRRYDSWTVRSPAP